MAHAPVKENFCIKITKPGTLKVRACCFLLFSFTTHTSYCAKNVKMTPSTIEIIEAVSGIR